MSDEAVKADVPAPCLHSRLYVECASCWYGAAFRLNRQNERLRRLIIEHGSAETKRALVEHDSYWLGANAPEATRLLVAAEARPAASSHLQGEP